MSGGSRGIGLAIALRAAADGANVAMLAKTGEPHPKLEGAATKTSRMPWLPQWSSSVESILC